MTALFLQLFAALYVVALVIAVRKAAWSNWCMLVMLISLIGSFVLFFFSFMLQAYSPLVFVANWEATFFQTCDVQVVPLFAHSQGVFVLLAQAVLLFLVLVCSTTWYCYICGCVKAITSCFGSGQSGTSESARLINAAARSSTYGERTRKKILFLMSDTGGGHRASAKAIVDALEAVRPGAFEVIFSSFNFFSFLSAFLLLLLLSVFV